ncbi:MAG: hypothetical protein JXR19_04200 [Bacteroidia bacterium]
MNKTIRTTLSIGVLLALFSFTFVSIPIDKVVGVYGVSDADPSHLELNIKQDYTFSYKDFSDPERAIDVKGTWVLKHRTVILSADNNQYPFHYKWKIVKDGLAAKSRKGMAFYRLVRI